MFAAKIGYRMVLQSPFFPSCRRLKTNSVIKDYYAVLHVTPTASHKEIKKAFFELSKKYHPDISGDDPQSRTKFVELTEAFSVLSKPESRQEYDAKRKLFALGLFGDGFRMEYPKPNSDLSPTALEAYQEEMRRRWHERVLDWARAQGAFELERGISMNQVRDVHPSFSRSTIFDRENRLYILLASSLLLFTFGYVGYLI
ncbi:Chaperone protein DnaJ [Fasciolopsis buskii]|uniref:Chaperone protein DnaJ n=1 Tax=Fasciolopsis buskii TaxID=27845 RepID=A0A8E0S9S1_9TREM|nr:Chaperone protein DnaJ [Fasciolopsis buski]